MDEESEKVENSQEQEIKDNPPGQGQSKAAKKRRAKRLSIQGKELPPTDPDSSNNDDVGSIPKADPQSSQSSSTNPKNKRTKAKSKFLGLDPTELEISMARSMLGMVQATIGVPPIPNGAFGVEIPWKQKGEPVFIADLPDNVTIINDKDEIVEVKKPFYWSYARAAKAMSGNVIDRGVDWIEDNPIKASIGSVFISTVNFVMAAKMIGDNIAKASQHTKAKEQPQPVDNKNNNENIKVDYVEGVPMPRVNE